MVRKKRAVPRTKPHKGETTGTSGRPVSDLSQGNILIRYWRYICRGTIPKSNKFEDVISCDCRFTMYRYPLKTLGKPEITPGRDASPPGRQADMA